MNIKKLALLIPALALLGSCSESTLVMADCGETERSAKVKRAPSVSSSEETREDFDSWEQYLSDEFLWNVPVLVSTAGFDYDYIKDIPFRYNAVMDETYEEEYSISFELSGDFTIYDFGLYHSSSQQDIFNYSYISCDVKWAWDSLYLSWDNSVSVEIITLDQEQNMITLNPAVLFEVHALNYAYVTSGTFGFGDWDVMASDLANGNAHIVRDMSENCPQGTFSGRYDWASVFSQVSTASCLIPQETPFSSNYIPGWWFYSNKEQPFVNLHADMVDLKAGSKISKEGQAVTTATDDQYKFIRAVYGIRSDNTKVKIAEYNPNYYYPLGGGAWSISTDIADDLWVVSKNFTPFLGVGICMVSLLNPDTGLPMDAYPNHDEAVVPPWDYLFNRAGGNVYEPWAPDLDWNGGESVTTENAVSSTFNLLGFAFGSMLPILSIQVMPGISLWVFLILPLVATIVVLVFKAVKK